MLPKHALSLGKGSLPAAPFRMPPLSEPVGDTGGQELNAKQSGVSGDKEAWVTVEGEFILADMAQVINHASVQARRRLNFFLFCARCEYRDL